MKNLINLIFLYPIFCFSQEVPLYETTIFFEDAIGNKDSIIVGYDPEANLDYNPNFGEIDISSVPFDSIFEVRAQHFNNWNGNFEIQTKKIVAWTEPFINNEYCLAIQPTVFFINIKHNPLKIYWDNNEYLDNICHTASFITPDKSFGVVDPPNTWWESDEHFPYACMAEQDTFIIDLSEYSYLDFYHLDTSIEGDGIDSTILGLVYVISPEADFFSPCRHILDIEEIYFSYDKVKVFPNPSEGVIHIETKNSFIDEVLVFSSDGVLVKTNNFSKSSINLTDLSPGIYYLQILDNEGFKNIQRIVKL